MQRLFVSTYAMIDSPYLRLSDAVPGELHHGEIPLADGPLDVVEPDADRRLRHPLPLAHARHSPHYFIAPLIARFDVLLPLQSATTDVTQCHSIRHRDCVTATEIARFHRLPVAD